MKITGDLARDNFNNKLYHMKLHIAIYTTVILFFLNACQSEIVKEQPMPEFNLMLVDSTVFSTKSIQKGSPVVTIYYDGSCDECHEEVKGIAARMEEMKDVRFYLITIEPLGEIKRFKDFLNLDRYPNIVVAKDTARFFPRFLNARTTPYMVLWDENKVMRAVYSSRPPVDTLINHIKNLEEI